MNKKIAMLSILLSLCSCAAPADESTMLKNYAPIKENICTDCKVNESYIKRPEQGLIFDEGALNAQYPRDFLVVDFQKNTITKNKMQYDYKTEKSSLVKKEIVKLNKACASQIMDTANKIWASKARLEVNMIMDVGWNLYLLDGQKVRQDGGPGTPSGLSETLSKQLSCH